ncbi:MAG: hypothetical protein FJ088_16865, partial [Deltaproteobacteria bacterium]|nr:hypothetical protein [Deltaproteobacteria bacterium]
FYDALLGAADFFGKFAGADEVIVARFTENGDSGLVLEVFSAVSGSEKILRLSKVAINIGEKPYPELFSSGIPAGTEQGSGRLFTYIALGASIASFGTGVGFNIKMNEDIDSINGGEDKFGALSADRTLMYSFYGAGVVALAAAVLLYFIEGQ